VEGLVFCTKKPDKNGTQTACENVFFILRARLSRGISCRNAKSKPCQDGDTVGNGSDAKSKRFPRDLPTRSTALPL